MIKKLILLTLLVLPLSAWGETIEECQQLAETNYPLVKQYDLIRQTEQFTLSNIAKGWLPQISTYLQGTTQSAVTELPDVLQQMLASQGMNTRGLSPWQYRAGIDVQQTLYDGGAISAHRAVAKAQSSVDEAQNSVNLYAMRQRVTDIYFGWLLVEQQWQQNQVLQKLLCANVTRLEALFAHGVAMRSDVDALRAELATVHQQQTGLEAQCTALRQVLSLLCGREVGRVEAPRYATLQEGRRPELTLYDRQLSLMDAQEKVLRARLMPRLGLFVQGYYGYVGLDMYHDMFHRYPTLNGLVGARLSWDLSSLYTHGNDRRRLQTQREGIEMARETFVFNQNIQQSQEQQNMERQRKLLAEDEEILMLRRNVREAAEAKLEGGIIDTNQLLQEISRENQAAINRCIHEVEYLHAIYELNNIKGI